MFNEKPPAALLAVFPAERLSEVREAIRALDVPAERFHVDRQEDERESLLAEQNEEARESFISPQVGVALPKEATKALAFAVPIAAVAGALVMMPFGLIHVDGLALGARLFWAAMIGATAAGTIAYVATAAMAAKDGMEPGAAQRGVVVRVDDTRPEVEQALCGAHPIRVDRIDEDGAVLGTVATEEDRESGGAAEEVIGNVRREDEASPTERRR